MMATAEETAYASNSRKNSKRAPQVRNGVYYAHNLSYCLLYKETLLLYVTSTGNTLEAAMGLKNFVRTREVGEFFSGALAGVMTKAVLAPLETLRYQPCKGNLTGTEVVKESSDIIVVGVALYMRRFRKFIQFQLPMISVIAAISTLLNDIQISYGLTSSWFLRSTCTSHRTATDKLMSKAQLDR